MGFPYYGLCFNRPTEFRCKYGGHCISSSLICDGVEQCFDRSDESPSICKMEYLCPLNAYKCNYGGCVPKTVQCDGFADCLDGSDESPSLCLALQCPICRKDIKCVPITSFRIDVVCEMDGRVVPCDKPAEPRTIAIYSCKYVSTFYSRFFNFSFLMNVNIL